MLKKLISIRIKSLLGSLVGRKGKGSRAGMIALIAVLTFSFLLLSASICSTVALVLLPYGYDWAYFTIIQLMSFGMVFFFSIFETKTELFECKDNELLVSMPIKPLDILLSRIFAILVVNVVESLVLVLPAVVFYLLFGGGVIGAVGCLLTAMILTLLATSLAGGIGYLVAFLSARFKNKSFATLAFSILFLVLYFFGYSRLMSGMDFMAEDPEGASIAISDSIGILKPIGEASLLGIPSFLILLGVCAVVIALVCFVMSKFYLRIITGTRGSISKKYKAEKLRSSSAYSALAGKEFARFASSSAYMLNGASGVIFQVIICGVLLFKRSSLHALAPEIAIMLGSDENVIFLAVFAFLSVIPMMNSISASALSMEGSSIDVLRSMPVDPSAVMKAKLTPHIAVSAAFSLVCSVVSFFALSAPLAFLPFYVVTPLIISFISGAFGFILNVAKPKFDYENENQVVKQSMPVTVITLVGMLGALVIAGITLMLGVYLSSITAAIIFSAAALLLAICMLLLLRGPTLRRLTAILQGKI